MKFSVVIPVYEQEERLLLTIDSIMYQTYKDYEILVQDGSPEDSITEVIKNKYGIDAGIRIFRDNDHGVYDAMNKAVVNVKGDYCLFMGAGDTLHDNKVLEDIHNEIELEKSDIIYGYWVELHDGKEDIIKRKLNWKYIVKFTPVNHQSVFAKTALLREAPFDTGYKIAADQEWLLRMKAGKKSFRYVDRAIVYYPFDGLSSNNVEEFVREQKEIHGKYYPFFKTVRYTYRRLVGKD